MKKNKQKPFFATFLENQIDDKQARTAQGGDSPYVTLKYPSDKEDAYTKPAADVLQTMKYPSDNDEEGPKS
jgi:hypothetical protein